MSDTTRQAAVLPQEVQTFISHAPASLQSGLNSLMPPRLHYFSTGDHLQKFVSRIEKYGPRIYREISPEMFGNTPLQQDVLFLLLTRGTIKDLVWQFGTSAREKISRSGRQPTHFFNIYSPEQAQKILLATTIDVEKEPLLKNTCSLADDLEFRTGHTISNFIADPSLYDIFADQVIVSVRDALKHRKDQLPAGAKRTTIETILSSLQADRSGDAQYILTDRGFEFMHGGDRAGDCTKTGSFNAWTNGAWLSTFENFELNTYYQGRFFARIIAMLGVSEEKCTYWAHAIEFAPEARSENSKSRLLNPNLQVQLISDTLAFLQAHGTKIGVGRYYITAISNSFGFTHILQPILKKLSPQEEASMCVRPFTLLNGVNTAHDISALVHGKSDAPHAIYLQGWGGPAVFKRTGLMVTGATDDQCVDFAGTRMSRHPLDTASRSLMGMISDEVEKAAQVLYFMGYAQFHNTMLEIVRYPDRDEKYNQFKAKLRQVTLQMASLFDPGYAPQVTKDLDKIDKQMDRKYKTLRQLPIISESVKKLLMDLTKDYKDHSAKFEEYVLSEPYYTGTYTKTYLSSLLHYMPAHRSSDNEAFAIEWWNNFEFARMSNKDRYRFSWRRPSELKAIENYLSAIVEHLRHPQSGEGEGIVTVANRLNPELLATFEKSMRDAQIADLYTSDIIRIIMTHPGELVNYYIHTSRSSHGDILGSVQANINVFDVTKQTVPAK